MVEHDGDGASGAGLSGQPADELDGPWKEALDRFFEPFLRLLFPRVHASIDWRQAPEHLDKERQKLFPEGHGRVVDKLVNVRRRSGETAYILEHVEVQSQRQEDFAQRMFRYHFLLFGRFKRDEHFVVSLAVLGDPAPTWRPATFTHALCGCSVRFEFPVVKLLDLEARWAELEQSDNPFTMVVMAHVKTMGG